MRRSLLAAGAGLFVLAAAAAGAAAYLPRDRASADGPLPPATAVITRGTLVETSTAQATLAHGPEISVQPRLTGTVTALSPVGSTVDRGRSLFRIDDKPVLLFYGTLPSYRDLTAGTDASGDTQGADVKEFEQNLAALGYGGFTVDDAYTAQTATAVRRWQKDLGLPQTGVVELGRIVYADGPILVATHQVAVGAVASGPVLTYTGTDRLVTASVKQHDKELAKVGTKVTVSLPNGKQIPGTVRSVRTPANDQSSAGQEPTLDVVVAPDDQSSVDGLDDGPARVQFVVQERRDVLMVPVGALLALSDGGYGLQVMGAGSSRVVAVTTGLFANGNVEVSGPDIREGTVVGMAK